MFDDEPETDEIRTTLSLGDAAEIVDGLTPGAKTMRMKRCAMFDLRDGDDTWAVVSVFEDSPTLVEARYLAGTADPRCARLQTELRAAFEASAVAPAAPAAPPSFRERLLDSLRGQREGGIRIRHLAFGPPASPELIERIEREHLGFPMPAALRDFFAAHDGVTLFFHRDEDPASATTDHAAPLAIERAEPLRWHHVAQDGGPIWSAIDEADFGVSPDGGFFYAGLICIPGLAEIFDTDWASIEGWPKGMHLFDAWHYFHGTALVVDRDKGEVYIQPTSDYGAERDAERVEVADYLDTLARNGGTDRMVNGRHQPTRSRG